VLVLSKRTLLTTGQTTEHSEREST